MSTRNGRLRRRNVVAATVAVLAMSTGAVALANDTIFPDGDTGVATPNLSYGADGNHACATRGTAVSGDITLNYNGAEAPITSRRASR